MAACPSSERARRAVEESEPPIVESVTGIGTGGLTDEDAVEDQRRRRRQGLAALARRERAIDLAPGPVLRRARVRIARPHGDREAARCRLADRRLDEAGLPDARLPADQQDATAAALGVREAVAQRTELDLASDEGDVGHGRLDARRSRSTERAMGRLFIARLRAAGSVTDLGRASGLRARFR